MPTTARRDPTLRALAVWLLIVALETAHGLLRGLLLVPLVGDHRARQLGVISGSLLILLVAWATGGWLAAPTARSRIAIGALWVALTLAFEIALGRVLGRSWADIGADFDPRAGGLLALGMLVLLLAPLIGARLRRR